MTHALGRWYVGTVPVVVALASVAAYADPQPVALAQSNIAVVALAPAPSTEVETPATAFPGVEAGVRHAAKQGNEALRRYIWRTRMIYNFYFGDFAKEQ